MKVHKMRGDGSPADDSKDEALKATIYALSNAVNAKDLSRASKIVSSLGVFEAARMNIGHILDKLRADFLEEQTKTQAIAKMLSLNYGGFGINGRFRDFQSFFDESNKIQTALDKAAIMMAYYGELARRDEKHFSKLYSDLMHDYESKPESLDIAAKVMKIEEIKLTRSNRCIKALSKELSNLETQQGKLDKLQARIQNKYGKEGTIGAMNEGIAKESIALLSRLQKEVAETNHLMNDVKGKISQYKMMQQEARLRIERISSERGSGVRDTGLVSFILGIFTHESKKKCDAHVTLPRHKEMIKVIGKKQQLHKNNKSIC